MTQGIYDCDCILFEIQINDSKRVRFRKSGFLMIYEYILTVIKAADASYT